LPLFSWTETERREGWTARTARDKKRRGLRFIPPAHLLALAGAPRREISGKEEWRVRSFIEGGGAWLQVDMSDVQRKISLLQSVLTEKQMERLLHRTFKEVGNKSGVLIAREAYKEYQVTQKWVKDQVRGYRLTYGGTGAVTCTIPLSSHKGTIGGRFKAYKLQKRISTDIVKKGGRSRLPEVMKNQGGNPPFVGGGKLGGVVFTRRTEERLPIVRVVGLGVPQMPLNRASDETQEALLKYAGERLDHNFDHMFVRGGK